MFINLSFFTQLIGFFIFLTGACIGSFLGVLSYRMPLNISISHPKRSYCDSCKIQLSNTALLPIFGYLYYKGRCHNCSAKIPIYYPIIELLTGIITVYLFFKYLGHDFIVMLYLKPSIVLFQKIFFNDFILFISSIWLFYTGIVLSIIDINYRLLLDKITLPGIIVGFLISCFNANMGPLLSLYGILVGFLGLLSVSKLYELIRKQEGIGMGDVKYLGFLGAIVGVKGVFLTLFGASVLGSFYGIFWGIVTKKGLSVAIPFGPFLALASFLYFLYFT